MKYSIIIPHCNRPKELIRCINSFKKLKNKEIIIVDDKSKFEIISKVKKEITNLNDDNIKFIHLDQKKFVGGARNVGLNLASYKWIFFIDDDDCATSNFIEFLNKTRLRNDKDFYRFPYVKISKTNQIKGRVKNILIKNNKYSFQISTFLFKRDFLIKNDLKFEENIMSEDLIFHMHLYNKINKPRQKYISNVYSIKYFLSNNSITRKKFNNTKPHEEILNYILNTNYKNKKTYCLYTLLWIYYLINDNMFENILSAKKELKKLIRLVKPNGLDYLRLNWYHYLKSFGMRIRY